MLTAKSHLLTKDQPESKVEICLPSIVAMHHSPLTYAAAKNDFKLVNTLLPVSDVNWRGIFGNTALHWAIANSNTKMALHLIDEAKGIDLGVQDLSGKTALHLAVGKGWYHFDNDVSKTKEGEPPQASVIESLIERSNLNIQDHDGNTALHIAVMRRDYNCVDLLLRKGAETNVRNKNGQLPIDMLQMDYEVVRTYIENYVQVFTLSKRFWNQNINNISGLFGVTTHYVIDESLENEEKKIDTSATQFNEAIQLLTVLLRSDDCFPPTNRALCEPRERFLTALKQLNNETNAKLAAGQLDQKNALILAEQSLTLTRKVAYCVVTKADIDSFHQVTTGISRWGTLGKILGAIVGAAIGVLAGLVGGPAAGLYTATNGAIIGASLGSTAMSALGFWAVGKFIQAKYPLSPLAIAATNTIIPLR